MPSCYAVMRKESWPARTKTPESIHLDRDSAQREVDLLIVSGRRAWIEELPLRPKCETAYLVMQRTRLGAGYINAPVSVHLDRDIAQHTVNQLNDPDPLKAWIVEVPHQPKFNIEGTKTGCLRSQDA